MSILSSSSHWIVRPWQMSDMQQLAESANNIHIWNKLRNSFPYPYTLNDARNWIKSNQGINPPKNFAIVYEDRVVGGIGFTMRDDINRLSAEIGYWLAEEYWNRGIMGEALTLVSEYAFNTFDLVRLFACVFETNYASIKVLEKAGFQFEAAHKASIIKNGQILDEFIFFKLDELGCKLTVKGKVQGVGFRRATMEEAIKLKLKGWVQNLSDGTVCIHIEGLRRSVRLLKDWCRIGPPHAIVNEVTIEETYMRSDFQYEEFNIRY